MKIIPLINGESFKNCILDILKTAQAGDEIIANYFAIRSDDTGNIFLHHLYQAALKGANVKLLIDDYACLHKSDEGTEYVSQPLDYESLLCLEEIGCEIYNYHKVDSTNIFALSNIANWSNYSRRNHNKNFLFNLKSIRKRGLVIGDSQWVDEHINGEMLGSNLFIEDTETYIDALLYTKKLLRSSHVERLRYGKLTRDKILGYEVEFQRPCEIELNSWNWYSSESIINPNSIKFVYSDINFKKASKRHTIQHYEVELIKRAQKKLWYCTPYFSPDLELQDAFIQASKEIKQGVNIFIGKYKDDPYLPYAVRKVAKRLIQNGMDIYEYNGANNIHYKDMLADDIVFIKTANGEGRSRYYNLETGVIIKSRELAKVITNKIKEDLKSSVQIEYTTNHLENKNLWEIIKGVTLCPLYYHHL